MARAPRPPRLSRGALDDGSAAVVSRLLVGNGVLAALGLVALVTALVSELFANASQASAALLIGGVAFVPMLWILATSLAAMRGAPVEPRVLLARQTVLVIAALMILTLGRLVWLLGPRPDDPGWIHYLVGVQTALVYYSGHLHAISRSPPLPRLHPMAAVGVVASAVIELGVVVRLLFPSRPI